MGVMQAYRVSTEIPDGKGDMQGTGVFPASRVPILLSP